MVRTGILPLPVGAMIILFAIIAMVAITNTTLVAVVTQSRILYGMAREGVVPKVFGRLHSVRRSPWVGLVFAGVVVSLLLVVGQIVLSLDPELDLVDRLATVTVVFLLFIYALVIISALKLRGHEDATGETYRAPTVALVIGILGNVLLLGYVVFTDPAALLWVGGLLALGLLLYLAARISARGQAAPMDHYDADQEA